ncbi:TetR family transcriptional regulator [Actinoplanes philippinensis]|uniref:DNA-binding transcriptional regulator, AcrR family n=1 Tax=Actinoplanes philippinensis TaxID=35752 RepID=A0A1I2HYV1_9ACTN|nr:TetR family transcriptional regulator [Actinoplanes philippinensis]GIE78890.1 TetR family transcriptional regulator [Actinoplanes philippinensis]SFF34520.1 DNA-binding transcriptional regulator, AcrR family [Actinoplanes philippinensis]
MSGLRERKKAETRAALGWAAIHLTAERGYDNVRVEDIAEAAGVSPRTFNNYFSSKAEAIASRHLDRSLRTATALRQRPTDEPLWTALTAAALEQFTRGPEVDAMPTPAHPHWATGIRAMLAEPALEGERLRATAIAETELVAAIADRTGTHPTDMYPRLVAAAATAAISVAMQHYLDNPTPTPIQNLITDAFTQIAAGLPTPTP